MTASGKSGSQVGGRPVGGVNDRAAQVPLGPDLVEVFGVGRGHRREGEVVDSCGAPHKSAYPADAIVSICRRTLAQWSVAAGLLRRKKVVLHNDPPHIGRHCESG
jgi:hypothetical protein